MCSTTSPFSFGETLIHLKLKNIRSGIMPGHVKHPFRGSDQLKVDIRIDDFLFVFYWPRYDFSSSSFLS